MSDLVKINNQGLQVKEYRGQRVVTFKDIDTVHERAEGTAKRNFNENIEHFIDGTDYFKMTYKEFSTNFVPNSKGGNPNNEIVLLTESGYLMLVKSLTDDLAWKVQRELVNNYFRAKEQKPTCMEDVLIQSLQEMKAVRLQLEEVKKLNTDNKQEIQNMRDVITLNPNSWRQDTTKLINAIAQQLGGFDHIKDVREESYKLLDERFGVDVKTRLTYKRRRMADEGVCKSRRDKLTVLDVIKDDKKLIEGYVAIVKEMAIKYKAA